MRSMTYSCTMLEIRQRLLFLEDPVAQELTAGFSTCQIRATQ